MAEWVNMPADCGDRTEVLQKELMAEGHLVNAVFIVNGSFVVHAITTIDELKLAISEELLYQSLHSLVLFRPPSFKEAHFDINESFARVGIEHREHGVQDILNTLDCDGLLRVYVVLVDGFEPAYVIMGVGNHSDVDCVACVGLDKVTVKLGEGHFLDGFIESETDD